MVISIVQRLDSLGNDCLAGETAVEKLTHQPSRRKLLKKTRLLLFFFTLVTVRMSCGRESEVAIPCNKVYTRGSSSFQTRKAAFFTLSLISFLSPLLFS